VKEYVTELRNAEMYEAPLHFIELVFGVRDFMNHNESIKTVAL
jgi:hypothetical protein